MNEIVYTAVVTRDANGWYTAHVPDLPGCTGNGRTFDEALHFVTEAAQRALDALRGRHRPMPQPRTEAVMIDAARGA